MPWSSFSSILMYPRTARSTSVDVISRGWTWSSSRVPASAGLNPGGGSYIGATETPGSGSRPLYHHRANITPKVSSGKKTIGLLPKNQSARVSELGAFRTPLGMKISTVSPPRMGRGSVVANDTSDPFTSAVAALWDEP